MIRYLHEHLTIRHWLAVAGAALLIAAWLAMVLGPRVPLHKVSSAISERVT